MIDKNRTERERSCLVWLDEKEKHEEPMRTSKRPTNRVANPVPPSLPPAAGFTLIELLVVIAIIGILAGLIVALSPQASRRTKTATTQASLNTLATAIDNHKSDLGFYPYSKSAPPNLDANGRVNVGGGTEIIAPAMNPLFYELIGTVFLTGTVSIAGTVFNQQTKFYISAQGGDGLPPMQCQRFFGVKGFQNMTTNPGKIKSFIELKANEFAPISEQPAVNLLLAPVRWPLKTSSIFLEKHRPIESDVTINNTKLRTLTPWQYRAPGTNNRATYDLWADVPFGDKVQRINNWGEPKILDKND